MRALILAFFLAACSAAGDQATEAGQNQHLTAAPLEARQDERCEGSMGMFQPQGGLIPNAAFAEEAARLYLRSLYTETFEEKRRMKIRLKNGIWFAETVLPEGWVGGSEYIEICRSNGRVLNFYATQ